MRELLCVGRIVTERARPGAASVVGEVRVQSKPQALCVQLIGNVSHAAWELFAILDEAHCCLVALADVHARVDVGVFEAEVGEAGRYELVGNGEDYCFVDGRREIIPRGPGEGGSGRVGAGERHLMTARARMVWRYARAQGRDDEPSPMFV